MASSMNQGTGPVDNTRIDTQQLGRLVLLSTVAFLLVMFTIFLAGNLPPTPNIPSPYNVEEWQQVEAQQTQILQDYGPIEEVQESMLGTVPEADEEAAPEQRYHIPISLAKELIAEEGLPVYEGTGSD